MDKLLFWDAEVVLHFDKVTPDPVWEMSLQRDAFVISMLNERNGDDS